MPSILSFLRGGAPKPNALPDLRITLARRLVETSGAPFVTSHEVFGDVASARDELGLLPTSQGPTVVRVRVEGGTASEQEALAGDWLVDPDVGGRVTRFPMPRWDYDEEATAWARERSWLEAWETCQDARWMLRAASEAGVERKLLVLAACACARTALGFAPPGEERPLRAIETAERWTRGEVSIEEVKAAGDASWEADGADDSVAYAAAWSADAAWADTANAVGISAASAAAAAACVFASAASAAAWDSVRITALARSADLVRGVIPTLVVLRAVALHA